MVRVRCFTRWFKSIDCSKLQNNCAENRKKLKLIKIYLFICIGMIIFTAIFFVTSQLMISWNFINSKALLKIGQNNRCQKIGQFKEEVKSDFLFFSRWLLHTILDNGKRMYCCVKLKLRNTNWKLFYLYSSFKSTRLRLDLVPITRVSAIFPYPTALKLLGHSWSVPVISSIFTPLKEFLLVKKP